MTPAELFQIFEDLPVGFVVVDLTGVIVSGNGTAADHLGLKPEELTGKDLFNEVLPELSDRSIGSWFRGPDRRGAPPPSITLDGETPQGGRSIEVFARSVSLADFDGALLVICDRTALSEEEKNRKRAESLASVGELAAGLAHEVNNPLASIKSFAQLLARDLSTAEQRHALELIIQECGRISRAVENVVAFARQQGASGREPVNLSALVERAIEVRRYSLDTAGIDVRLDLDASLSPVMGERGALQQVILTLVTRAEGELAQRPSDRMLIVRTRESSEGVVLYVVDNGPGIPRTALPHLFDPYLAATEGQGIELATSARIVRDHGGYILAESEPGRGSAFFVRLPRAGAPPISATPDVAITAPPSPRKALRVLIADDEPTLRLAISLFLNRRGHRVTQAADAYEALRLAREQPFDVALVDARMPGDGLVLLQHLEKMPTLAGRTALMTGDLGRARTTQGIPSDRPYLVKPFDMNEAVSLIERLGDPERV